MKLPWLLLLGALAAPISAQEVELRIRADSRGWPVSPLLYGQFAEFMFEDIKGGLSAEMLKDRGFEEPANAIGLPRYWERDPDDRNDDAALTFRSDPALFMRTGAEREHSLQLTLASNGGERRGLRQSGLPVRAGLTYHGYVWVHNETFRGQLTAALEADQTGGEVYATAAMQPGAQDGEWRQYTFDLKPNRSDPLAKLAILVAGEGNLHLDQASLLPGDAVGGVRADVMDKVRSLRPAFVRWPGGNVAQDYWWTWGVGPRDHRPSWVNLSWRNEPEPSDFGTDEYIQFCRQIGAAPALTVNVEGRGATPELAAHWVEYCNGPATSEWGARRAANGHPEPYNVRYWEVGNEIWGSWVRGHSDAATYAANFTRYAAAMRAVDPQIRLIGCGDNDMEWNRVVLAQAGAGMDFLAVHHYYGPFESHGDRDLIQTRPLYYEQFYRDLQALTARLLPGKQLPLAINEWNTTYPLLVQHSMESALYGARMLNVFLRSEGRVGMSCVSDMVNGWSGGVIQASRHGVYMTPTGLVNALYAQRGGPTALPCESKSPANLDVAVTRDEHHLYVHLVNSDLERPQPVRVLLQGQRVAPGGRLETLNGPTAQTPNSFREPDAVRWQTSAAAPEHLLLPAHSVSILTLEVIP